MRGIVFASTTALSIIFASAAFAGSNTVYLGQTGNSQKAEITQSGNNSWVGTSTSNPFVQENGAGYGGNTLKVDQWIGGNTIGLYGTAKQSGTTNNVDIRQFGGGNIELLQVGTNNGTGSLINNYGDAGNIQQGGQGGGKIAVVEFGNNNGFNIWQGGSNNTANLTQAGENLKAVVRQSYGGSDTSVGKPYPIDTASSGTITINQGTGSSGSYSDFAYGVQGGALGSGNTMALWQDGSQLVASVWQDGAHNEAESHQFGSSNSLGKVGPGTNTPFFQEGSYNHLLNYQYGNNNEVTGSQTGADNLVSSVQYGSYSTANFVQDGTYNKAYNSQYDIASASVSQDGFNNYSLGVQSGGGWGSAKNTATISQDGNNNISVYAQSGYSNSLSVTQTGNSNASNIAQNGNSNQAIVQQN
jgi:hypothetical protein